MTESSKNAKSFTSNRQHSHCNLGLRLYWQYCKRKTRQIGQGKLPPHPSPTTTTIAYQKKPRPNCSKKKISDIWNKNWKYIFETTSKNSYERLLQEVHRLHSTKTRPSHNLKNHSKTYKTHPQHLLHKEEAENYAKCC